MIIERRKDNCKIGWLCETKRLLSFLSGWCCSLVYLAYKTSWHIEVMGCIFIVVLETEAQTYILVLPFSGLLYQREFRIFMHNILFIDLYSHLRIYLCYFRWWWREKRRRTWPELVEGCTSRSPTQCPAILVGHLNQLVSKAFILNKPLQHLYFCL